MPDILILSSFVAASRVGGSAQVAALERMGVRTTLAPTVTFGRHPGLGPPGGGPVEDQVFESLLAGAEQAGALEGLSAMICGYFASPGQVAAAARTIDKVRMASPSAPILVDPILGDEERGLYVSEAVADAIARDLVSRADILAPNAWELARLTERPTSDLAKIRTAAKSMGRAALISSVPVGDDIGVLLATDSAEILARHRRLASAPKGAGDLLVALFAGSLAEGISLDEALAAAVAETAALVAGESLEVIVERLDG